ncbi:MAG: DNA starvation/stationary phase protection protein [Pseudomonadota bacterium]
MTSTAAVLRIKPDRVDVDTGLPKDAREKIASDLGQVLGETYMLLVKTHVYHWNVVGPLFLSLHELTEAQYNDLFKASDEIAERIRALGFVTPLSFAAMAKKADIAEEKTASTAEDMVEQLVKDHESIVRSFRTIAGNAEEHGDYVTHDLLVGRMEFHEKAIWMLRAIVA